MVSERNVEMRLFLVKVINRYKKGKRKGLKKKEKLWNDKGCQCFIDLLTRHYVNTNTFSSEKKKRPFPY